MKSMSAVMPDLCNRRFPFHYMSALMLLKTLGVDISKIHLKAIGIYENYKGEIHHQKPAPGTTLTESTEISLEVGYSSAVDFMPFQFFYGINNSANRSNQWEDDARSLMAPFDGATLRWTTDAGYESLKFALATVEYEHVIRFLQQFGFDTHSNTENLEEAMFWATALPSFHYWAGNPKMVCGILEFLFGYRFEIKENTPSTHAIPREIQSRLGTAFNQLGTELALGESFTELDSCYEVIVDGVKPHECADWLPGKPKRNKLKQTLQLCMPGHLQYHIKIKVEHQKTKLGYKEAEAYLGVATHI